MAREKLGKVQKSIGFTPEMVEEIKARAGKLGIGWTTMVPILVRKGLEAEAASESK